MAIVINGSGTVTGLAVGGLPDGTVDSGTIATGTIVDADVANVAASKLTGALPAISGASLTSLPGPTAATMPTSSIIGVQQAWMAGTQTITTTEADVTDGGTGLTITSTNTDATKFLIRSNIYVGGNSDVGCWFFLYVNIDGAGYTKLTAAHSNYGGGGNSTKNFMTYCAGDNDTWNEYTSAHASQEYLYTPSFSTSVAFKIRSFGYSGNHYIGRMANHNNSSSWSHASPSSLTVYEIK